MGRATQRRRSASANGVGRAPRAEAILAWREYAFCLYPADTLRQFFFELLGEDGLPEDP